MAHSFQDAVAHLRMFLLANSVGDRGDGPLAKVTIEVKSPNDGAALLYALKGELTPMDFDMRGRLDFDSPVSIMGIECTFKIASDAQPALADFVPLSEVLRLAK